MFRKLVHSLHRLHSNWHLHSFNVHRPIIKLYLYIYYNKEPSTYSIVNLLSIEVLTMTRLVLQTVGCCNWEVEMKWEEDFAAVCFFSFREFEHLSQLLCTNSPSYEFVNNIIDSYLSYICICISASTYCQPVETLTIRWQWWSNLKWMLCHKSHEWWCLTIWHCMAGNQNICLLSLWASAQLETISSYIIIVYYNIPSELFISRSKL